MSDDLHTLLWYPESQQIERASRELPGPHPEAFALHRSFGPELGLKMGYAELGASVLPPSSRPVHGELVRLLWRPLVPSRCLLAAPDASGVMRITEAALDEELARTMEHFEVEVAWAFEEARAELPHIAELRDHLETALEMATRAVALFAEQVPAPPFWTVAPTAPARAS